MTIYLDIFHYLLFISHQLLSLIHYISEIGCLQVKNEGRYYSERHIRQNLSSSLSTEAVDRELYLNKMGNYLYFYISITYYYIIPILILIKLYTWSQNFRIKLAHLVFQAYTCGTDQFHYKE
jgi:hypothetical protein